MSFCGQCGYQLAPGIKTCPRCGAAAEVEIEPTRGDMHADDPTVAAQAFIPRNPTPTSPPQRLILRPGPDNNSYGPQGAYGGVDAASYGVPGQADAPPNYGTYQSVASQYPGMSQPGILPQTGAPQGHMTQSGGNYPQQGMSYPGFAPQAGYPMQAQQQQQQQEMALAQEMAIQEEARNSRGRITGLVLILLGLLFVLSAVVLFTMQRSASQSNANNTTGPVTQAQAVIQQYYADINKKDYTSAYSLWLKNPKSIQAFQNGFKHTQQDILTINSSNQEADGTVKFTVTVTATETTTGSGEKTSTYNGYYLVKQQADGLWKITDAQVQ